MSLMEGGRAWATWNDSNFRYLPKKNKNKRHKNKIQESEINKKIKKSERITKNILQYSRERERERERDCEARLISWAELFLCISSRPSLLFAFSENQPKPNVESKYHKGVARADSISISSQPSNFRSDSFSTGSFNQSFNRVLQPCIFKSTSSKIWGSTFRT